MRWFKHDADANMDAKLQEVLLDYGLEGYGLFWYCLELITNKVTSENITFQLEHDARIIARNTGSSTQKVEEMMKKFISLGLFEGKNGVVTCYALAKRLDQSMTNSRQMRDFIGKLRSSSDVMTLSSNVMKEQNRTEQKLLLKNTFHSDEFFEIFWTAYNYKNGKVPARKSWDKIDFDETLFDSVIDGAKKYSATHKKLKANGTTIKMAQGWLTDERWNDELETTNNNNGYSSGWVG